jgi:hypothetical protein
MAFGFLLEEQMDRADRRTAPDQASRWWSLHCPAWTDVGEGRGREPGLAGPAP